MRVFVVSMFLLWVHTGFAQVTSYLNLVDVPFPFPVSQKGFWYIDSLGNSALMKALWGTIDGDCLLLEISDSGDLLQSYSFRITGGYWWHLGSFSGRSSKYVSTGFSAGFSGAFVPSVFFFDPSQNNFWARKTGNKFITFGADFVTDDQILVSHTLYANINPYITMAPDSFGLALLNTQDGTTEWSYFYRPIDYSASGTLLDLDLLPGNLMSILRGPYTFSSSFLPSSFLLFQIDFSGDFIRSKGQLSDSIQVLMQTVDALGNVYISGRVGDEDQSEETSGFIAKLDSTYEVVWAKRFFAENFPCTDLVIETTPENELFFAYVTEGDLPIISGKLTSEGELLWNRGYSFFKPAIAINPDGAIYFAGGKKYYPDGSWEPYVQIARADAEGEFEACPQFDACLEVYDMDFVLEEYQWIKSSTGPDLEAVEIELIPQNLTTTPYCGSPTPPHPYFYLPDTICAGECLTPDSTYNRLAHQVEWYITGPGGLDTTIVDTTFTWCFDQPEIGRAHV